MLSGFYFAGKQEKNFKKPLTRREICGIIITTKEPSGVQTGKVLQFNTPLQTKDVEIKMLVHSQRAVAAENTAERRAYQMDHRGRSQRRCPYAAVGENLQRCSRLNDLPLVSPSAIVAILFRPFFTWNTSLPFG